MKKTRLFLSVVLSLAVLFGCVTVTTAYAQEKEPVITNEELIQAVIKRFSYLDLTYDQVEISSKLELNNERTVFSFRLIGSFAYPAVLYHDELGKYAFQYSAKDELYLYERTSSLTAVPEAYRLGLISNKELDIIAEHYSAEVVLLSYYGEGFHPIGEQLEVEVKFGDANLDGTVDILDVTAIQRVLVNLEDFGTVALNAADYDHDESITILDATAIQRALARLIVPAEHGGTFINIVEDPF